MAYILSIRLFKLVDIKKDDTDKKSFKIPKGQSEFIYRRGTDNTMAKRKSTKRPTTIYKTYI
jgi:hypothetical protein